MAQGVGDADQVVVAVILVCGEVAVGIFLGEQVAPAVVGVAYRVPQGVGDAGEVARRIVGKWSSILFSKNYMKPGEIGYW